MPVTRPVLALLALAMLPVAVLDRAAAPALAGVSIDTQVDPSPVGEGLTRFTYTLHNDGQAGDPGLSIFTLPFFDDYSTLTAAPGASFNAPIGWTWVYTSGVAGFGSYGYSAAADAKASTYNIPASSWETGANNRLSFLAGSLDLFSTTLQFVSAPNAFIAPGQSQVFSIDVGFSKADNGPFMAQLGDFDPQLHGSTSPVIGDPLLPITPGHPLYDGPRVPEPATVALLAAGAAAMLAPRHRRKA